MDDLRTTQKTPGQLAYEEDVRRQPTYYGGGPRKAWDQLADWAQRQWDQDPTPREYVNGKLKA